MECLTCVVVLWPCCTNSFDFMITTFIYFEYIYMAIEYILHMTRFVILEWEILLSTYIWSCCTNSFDLMVTISLSCLQCWKVQRKYSLPPIKNILQNWNPKQKGSPMYDMQMDLFSHYVSGTVHVLFINKRICLICLTLNRCFLFSLEHCEPKPIPVLSEKWNYHVMMTHLLFAVSLQRLLT